MSCEEKERGIGKKGGGPSDAACGPKVIRKEKKKRRLILSDSESDEFLICPRRKIDHGGDQNVDGFSVGKKKDMVRMNQKDEIFVHRKKGMRSDAEKQREEVVAGKKRITDLALKRKRREAPDAEIPLQKIKMDSLKCGRDKIEVMGDKKLKIDSSKRGNERGEICICRSPGSKPTVPAGMECDNMKQKQMLSNLIERGKISKSEAENIRWKERLGCQTHRTSKHKSGTAAADKRLVGGISLQKGVRIQGKGGVLRFLPSNKKVSGLEKVHNQRGGEERSKSLGSPSIAKLDMSMQSSLSADRKVLKKSSSTDMPSKKQLHKGKVSSSEKDKVREPKSEQQILSPQRESSSTDISTQSSPSGEKKVLDKSTSTNAIGKIQLNKEKIPSYEKNKLHKPKSERKIVSLQGESENLDGSNSKTDHVVKGESSSSLKTPLPTKQSISEASVGRNTAKQKIRDQIRKMLLNAGWRIDLRPRRNRKYEDAVYVSPQGTGYWSITKAYEVFQDQLNCACDDECKDLIEKSSNLHSASNPNFEGTSFQSPAITVKELSMLRRKVVNKRGHKPRLEESENRLGDSRNRKTKETSKMSDLNRPLQDKIAGIKGRKKSNCTSCIGVSTAHKHLQTGRNKQRGCALLARGANQDAEVEIDDYVPYAWKRTVLSWMIDLGVVPENGKVKYMNKKKTRAKLQGWITREGIRCSCCSKILTVSKFELHAGSKLHQPYQNVYVEDSGLSLLQCQLNAWEKQDESERQGYYNVDINDDDPNDDTCGICGDGGDLICCDGCPSTFHLDCLGIEMLPAGDWHCTNCSCRFCGLVSPAVQESDLPPFPLLLCVQCGKKYHQHCIPEADAISVGSNYSETSFCGVSCRKVYKQLHKILGVKNDLEAGFSWSIIHRFDEDTPESQFVPSQWAECNSKIAVALAVMDECFIPIIDQRSSINLIHNVVYNCGSNFNRLNYSGFYTFILERGDEIISVASIRIHGTRLAEMPFIGTRDMYRRQGMCRRLINGIESALCSLNVEKLVIPAISEMKDTWTTVFGFKPLEIPQEREAKSINMLVFPGTGLLQKPLFKKHSDEQHRTACVADKVESDIKQHQMLEVANESPALSIPKTNFRGSNGDHHEHQVKDVGTSSPDCGGCVDSASEVLPVSSDAHGSEVQTPKYKSSETTDVVDLHVHHDSFYQDDPVAEAQSQENFSIEPDTALSCKVTMDDNHEVKIVNAGMVAKLHDINDSLLQNTEAKCMSPYSTLCTLQEAGENTEPTIPDIDGNQLQHNVEAHFTSAEIVAPTLQECTGNNLQLPVCSMRCSSDHTHHCRPEETGKSKSSFSVASSFQESSELILDGNHGVDDPVPTSERNLVAFDESSGCSKPGDFDGTIVTVAKESLLISAQPDIHAINADAVPEIHEVKTEFAAVEGETYANVEDSEPYAIVNAGRLLNIADGKESLTSPGISLTHDFDIVSICPTNDNSVQVSDERFAPHDSKLLDKTIGCHNLSHYVATGKPHHENHDSLKTLHLSSVSECVPSKGGDMLKNFHERNSGLFEQSPCGLGENSAQHEMSVRVGEIKGAACEPNILSCGNMNSEVLGKSQYTDVACSLTPDASIHIFQPNLTRSSEPAVDVPFEPDRVCYEAANDISILKDEVAPVSTFLSGGLGSVHCASEVLTKLDNGSDSNNGC
ncbi:uncharacterized protein LOC103712121 [Phoenix dactylifera]|uniref:Uncharacterized protein LOC103712121 n=1 Tax=Phoenix dactylifera TaxID=42345 RepID=A0A8B7CDB6_PHODC|nr:uncharacterized protein LOC103712121 [Phoenix dactylifera]XP_008796762.2 uncharacterized protein LOC103712121 [Phoenix dactylifera]XP_008796763.2 uncharacterized protein LOC103712121 [Phoenix dactylifera]